MATKKNKCTYCEERFLVEGMVKTPVGKFCTFDHAISYAKDKQAKDRAVKLKRAAKCEQEESKEAKKAVKELNRRNLRWQHKQTQISFNKLRVLQEKKWFSDRGLVPVCISCGKPNMDWCCGHFKSRGAQSGLRYDERNTFLQCNRYCNMGLSGNIEGNKTTRGYKKGLLERFGNEEGQAILDYCESNTAPVKWTWEDLEKMRSSLNKRARITPS